MTTALAILIAIAVIVLIVAVLAVAFSRRSQRNPLAAVDAHTLSDPWRRFVLQAQSARRRFDRALGVRAGPLHDRLVEIGTRIDAGVQEVWQIAQRGDALDDAVDTIDASRAERRLDALAATDASPARDEAQAALNAQQESAERLRAVAEDAKAKLRLLNARLDESVARGLELALNAGTDAVAIGLSDDVGTLVDEMEALRLALEEVGPGQPGTATA